MRQALLPHSKPVSDGFIGSGFGWRSDPFSGEMSHHSGIDFAVLQEPRSMPPAESSWWPNITRYGATSSKSIMAIRCLSRYATRAV